MRLRPHRHDTPTLRPPGDDPDRADAGVVPVPAWQEWAETAALAGAAVLLLRRFLQGGDHLLLHGGAWLALAPLLASLRYGSLHGLACGAVAVAGVMASRASGGAQGATAELALGWLLAGLLPGVFRDAWGRRLRGLEARTGEQGKRLEGLGRAYHALAASHDRLQLETGIRSTLRDALDAFRRELLESPAADAHRDVAPRVLALMREVASVRAAALYPVGPDGRPRPAAARLGRDGGSSDDPLVLEAARSGQVVSVRERPAGEAVLAAVPLVDVAGRVHAVVAVHDVPFLALHEDTLALLAVLGGHAGDLLSRLAPAPRAADAAEPTRRFGAIPPGTGGEEVGHGVVA